MRKIWMFLGLILSSSLFSIENLPQDYCVYYGNSDSTVTIVQYFSFTCPHCIALFRQEFQKIKETYIDTGKVYWVFHPVPMDLLTVQGMDCLQKLNPREKRIFLEAILEEVVVESPQISVLLMQKGMEVLEKPNSSLQEKSYLSETKAFQDAFLFLKQEDLIKAVPAVGVNGILYPGQIPDQVFLDKILSTLGKSA